MANRPRITALARRTAALVAAVAFLWLPVNAAQVCELLLTDCPENYNGDTLVVPDYVVSLSSSIHACLTSVTFQDTSNSSRRPSILFVIDNSGSMNGNDPNDPDGSRFTVTRALLDTIIKSQPQAEVGLIVFREHLFFDTTTSQYYTKYFEPFDSLVDGEPDQAYLPLMGLSQTYDGRLGIDILKDVLTTSGNDLAYQPNYRNLRPNSGGGETNINGAFLAVQQAMLSAQNPAGQQFVIFLSDGEPAGTTQAGRASNWFTQGINMPTTFTVYFTSNGVAPPSLETMTASIQQNGYSATNPQSDLWAIQTSYDALMRLFMEQILSNILIPGNPTRIVVNSRTSSTYSDSTFLFSSGFPLNDTTTRFSLEINYRYLDTTDHIVDDSTISSVFYVRRQTGAPIPAGVDLYCENIPTIDSVPLTATLLDTSGDGHLDRIDFTWSDTGSLRQVMAAPAEFIRPLQITTLDGKTVTLVVDTMIADPANQTIHVILRENTGATMETGWQSAQVKVTGIPMMRDGRSMYVSRVVDGAGPVITSARYYLDPQTGRDSLVVTFSEPVVWQSSSITPANAFRYYRIDTLKTAAFEGLGSSDLAQRPQGAVVIMDNDFVPVGGLDSLQLNGSTSLIADASGVPPPENGRKAPVVYAGEKTWAGVIVNPFVPGAPLPPMVRTYYAPVITAQSGSDATPGTIVGIQTQRPLKPRPDGSYGTVAIYDAVANLVRGDVRVYQVGVTDYGIFWDGRNRNSRVVGGGTYLFVLSMTDIDNKTTTRRLMVGVRQQ